MAYQFNCYHFSGYKPCKHKRACDGCPYFQPVGTRVVVVSLEALGAVLRSTVLLAPLRRKYPDCHITWITYSSARPLLEHNPLIDRLISVQPATIPVINHLEFDVLCAVDKSMEAGALAETIKANVKYGFGLTPQGAIRPLSAEAAYQFEMGLNDQLKFYENQQPETRMITETMGLEWKRDPYILELTADERRVVAERRERVRQDARFVIGYNTGCSLLYPYKKFTVERSIEIIAMWRKHFPDAVVALLGGPEDSERQEAMKAAFASDPRVVNTPTRDGLRSGVLWMDTADMVLSGCSLGLHIALGLKKPIVTWFGVSCSQEIDLFDRGIKLQSGVKCSPCWRKSCTNEPKCFNMVAPEKILEATRDVVRRFVSLG